MNSELMVSEEQIPSKIAVFGSAFNPPSLGHKDVIESLSHFDQVLLVPSISHAWGKQMLSFETRCTMVELFIKDIKLENIKLSKVERKIYCPGESVTTYAVLKALQNDYPNSEITFVIGPDNLLKFDRFFKASEILKYWSVMACPEKLPIRSTNIRENRLKMRSVAKLTTTSVEKYLIEHKLYEL